MCEDQSRGLGINVGDLTLLANYSKKMIGDGLQLPAVSPGYFQSCKHARCPGQADWFKVQACLPEAVDDISKTLPSHHVYQCVTHEVGQARFSV